MNLRDLDKRGPRWVDVMTPDQAQRFQALRARAEIRRIAELDRRLSDLARQVARKPRVR